MTPAGLRGFKIGHADDVLFDASVQQATSGADGWRLWVPAASAVIAGFALMVTISNRRIAKKALRLSERQEERRVARLDISLSEGISWRPARSGSRWVGISILAVNPTDRDGAVITADLHVSYAMASGTGVVVKIPHGAQGVALPEGIVPLDIPTPLPANGAVAGWLVFKIDEGLVPDGRVQRYDAVLCDSRGPVEAVQAWVLREVTDGEAS